MTFNLNIIRGITCVTTKIEVVIKFVNILNIRNLYYTKVILKMSGAAEMWDISKHKDRVLPYYHINITLTQSHVPSVNTQLQSCHIII